MSENTKRRTWTTEQKAAILAQLSQDTVANVAKKNGIGENLLYMWRKQAGMVAGTKKRVGKKRRAGKKKRAVVQVASRRQKPARVAANGAGSPLAAIHEARRLLGGILPQLDAFADVWEGLSRTIGGKGLRDAGQ